MTAVRPQNISLSDEEDSFWCPLPRKAASLDLGMSYHHRPVLSRQAVIRSFSSDNDDSCFIDALETPTSSSDPTDSRFPSYSDPTSPTSPNSPYEALTLGSKHNGGMSEITFSSSESDAAMLQRGRTGSIVDGLLHEIYDHWHLNRHDSIDSDTMTECSSTSEMFSFHQYGGGGRHDLDSMMAQRTVGLLSKSFLQTQSITQLTKILTDIQRSVAVMNVRLVKQLKRRDRRLAKLQRNFDIVTAILQAASLKRQIDTRMKFSLQPAPGQSAFDQWRDAMKAVCRLPLGIPPEFRKKVWLSLADHYLYQLKINWEKTVRFVFNERSNPDDDKLGMQIVKDLHRTGCSNFSGDDNEEDRAVLKRLLLAYARWNKRVGYCQGFNVIAALLLNVMEHKEADALKVMIYLIDSVLPESYFANNLRALSVDMAVFRDLLRMTFPKLSKHLDSLQMAAQDVRTGACYEPPLTNVFTMQWFLTLFATCLPLDIVLRVWDSILLEGSEILLRTALTIWGKLSKRIMAVTSADEFYSLMGELSSSIMQGSLFSGDAMVKSIYSFGDFPFPNLNELREKYTYNIRPFTPSSTGTKKSGSRSAFKSLFNSDDDELDDEDITAMACMPGDVPTSDISSVGPGVYGSGSDDTSSRGAPEMERMTTDIQSLKLQYDRLKQRQQQAHIIIAAASAKKSQARPTRHQIAPPGAAAALVPSIESPTAMNHLFVGKTSRGAKNQLYTDGPRISAPNSGLLTQQLQAVANAKAVSKSKRMRSGISRNKHAVSSSQTSGEEEVGESAAQSQTAESTKADQVTSEANSASFEVVKSEDEIAESHTVQNNNSETDTNSSEAQCVSKEEDISSGQNSVSGKDEMTHNSESKASLAEENNVSLESNAESITSETEGSVLRNSSLPSNMAMDEEAIKEIQSSQDMFSHQDSDNISYESSKDQDTVTSNSKDSSLSEEVGDTFQAVEQNSETSDSTKEAPPSLSEKCSAIEISKGSDLKDDSGVDSPSANSPALSPGSSRITDIDISSLEDEALLSVETSPPEDLSSLGEINEIVSISMKVASPCKKGEERRDSLEPILPSDLSTMEVKPQLDVTSNGSPRRIVRSLSAKEDRTPALPTSPTDTTRNHHPQPKSTTDPDNEDVLKPYSKQLVSRRLGQQTVVIGQKPYKLGKGARRLSSPACGYEDSAQSSLQATGVRKAFNPFPVKQHLNTNRMKTGLKLGLYSPSTIEQLKGFKSRTTSS